MKTITRFHDGDQDMDPEHYLFAVDTSATQRRPFVSVDDVDEHWLIAMFERAAREQAMSVHKMLDDAQKGQGLSAEAAWNACSVELCRTAKVYYFTRMKSRKTPKLKKQRQK